MSIAILTSTAIGVIRTRIRVRTRIQLITSLSYCLVAQQLVSYRNQATTIYRLHLLQILLRARSRRSSLRKWLYLNLIYDKTKFKLFAILLLIRIRLLLKKLVSVESQRTAHQVARRQILLQIMPDRYYSRNTLPSLYSSLFYQISTTLGSHYYPQPFLIYTLIEKPILSSSVYVALPTPSISSI